MKDRRKVVSVIFIVTMIFMSILNVAIFLYMDFRFWGVSDFSHFIHSNDKFITGSVFIAVSLAFIFSFYLTRWSVGFWVVKLGYLNEKDFKALFSLGSGK